MWYDTSYASDSSGLRLVNKTSWEGEEEKEAIGRLPFNSQTAGGSVCMRSEPHTHTTELKAQKHIVKQVLLPMYRTFLDIH